MKRLVCCCLALLAWAGVQAQPLVAAASDLKFALDAIATQYRNDTGQSVRLVFGSSGTFATQIQQGAPFDIFLSADESYAQKLVATGVVKSGPVAYALGRVALFVPRGSPVRADERLEDLGLALRDGRLKRLAIANPDHAPYGLRAMQILQATGLREAALPRLIYGENVSQAASFASVGDAQAALVALSLVAVPPLSLAGSHVVIPAHLHEPLRQSMVLLKRSDAGGEAFFRYLQQDKARSILATHGLGLPR